MFSNQRLGKVIYADHSATTKVRSEVSEAMQKVLTDNFGNPSSIHSFGRKAKKELEDARNKVADLIKAESAQIYFTSGGTESDNLVISGLVQLFNKDKILFKNKRKKIITSQIEHSAVQEPLEYLQNNDWEIIWLNVDKEGFIDINQLQEAISDDTLLVSIIYANNEIGTIQNLKQISNICHKHGVLFHTDAVQALGKMPIDVKDLDVDFLSMSAHKIYGPKGTGGLYIKSRNTLEAMQLGGSQENKIRPGTENIAGAVGFGEAARFVKKEMFENAKTLRKFQLDLISDLSQMKDVFITGPGIEKVRANFPLEKFLYRIPGHVSICTNIISGESLVLQLDLKGIAVSSTSACKSKEPKGENSKLEPSQVLLTCGYKEEHAKGSLRITFGRDNTDEEVQSIAKDIKTIIESSRKSLICS